MRFRELGLAGAWIVDPEPNLDERGSFTRMFCEREFAAHGLESRFVQHSHSHSRQSGTLRGLHFQDDPNAEIKLVSCLRGRIFDVIVDLRRGSATRHDWTAVELSAANRRQLYIPKGFAHGFLTLDDDVVVGYLISEFHVPQAARGIRYDDPLLAIDWPFAPRVVSERDLEWPHVAAELG